MLFPTGRRGCAPAGEEESHGSPGNPTSKARQGETLRKRQWEGTSPERPTPLPWGSGGCQVSIPWVVEGAVPAGGHFSHILTPAAILGACDPGRSSHRESHVGPGGPHLPSHFQLRVSAICTVIPFRILLFLFCFAIKVVKLTVKFQAR